jgi:hypothetical protein
LPRSGVAQTLAKILRRQNYTNSAREERKKEMPSLSVKTVQEVEVKTLIVSVHVRYWEDATINGKEDTDGTLTPFRNGDCWNPSIDIETGTVINWPVGTIADIHFKVCDEGVYQLADVAGKIVKEIDGYVPKIMCPEDSGYGDYIIMKIDASGKINKWEVVLSEFEDESEE